MQLKYFARISDEAAADTIAALQLLQDADGPAPIQELVPPAGS